MNSSSRSHCSCCQSWDNKGSCCVADLRGKGSLLPGIPWLPWGTLRASSPATQARDTAADAHHFIREKRGQFHMARNACSWTLWASHGLQHFSINSGLLFESQAGQNDEEQNHRLFKMCTVPITCLTIQGMVPLSLKLQQHDVTSKQALF